MSDISTNDGSEFRAEPRQVVEGTIDMAMGGDFFQSLMDKVDAKGEKLENERKLSDGAVESSAGKTETEEKTTEEKIKALKYALEGQKGLNEIPENAKFRVKVDGKPVDVTLRELADNFSGKTNWNQKYSEFETERKKFSEEKQVIDSAIERFVGLNNEGKMYQAFEFFLENVCGIQPHKFMGALQNELLPKMEKWSQMTPEQRELANLKAEAEYYKRAEAAKIERERQASSKKDLEAQVQSAVKSSGVTQEEFGKAYYDIVESGVLPKQAIEKLSPQDIAFYVQEVQKDKAFTELIDGVGPNPKIRDQAIAAMKKIHEQHPEFTVEDLKEIAMDTFGNAKAKTLSKKIAKSQPNTATKSEAVIKPQHGPTFFDDL